MRLRGTARPHAAGGANLAGSLTLSETAVVVSHARIYIGPDTAVTHLAAALGVPVVALYGPPIR